MISSRQKKHKKFAHFLPLVVLIFLGIFFVFFLKNNNFGITASFFERQKMVKPLSSPTDEERLGTLLKTSGFEVYSINPLRDSIEVSMAGNLNVIFSKEKDYTDQIASLQFILERSKIEGKVPSKIDLRFSKPVLTY